MSTDGIHQYPTVYKEAFQHVAALAWAAFFAYLAIRDFRLGHDVFAAAFAVLAIELVGREAIDQEARLKKSRDLGPT